MLSNRIHSLTIQLGISLSTLQGSYHSFSTWLGSIVSQWRQSAVNNIYTGLNSLQIGHGTKAGSVMSMQLNWQIHSSLQLANQILSYIRLQQTRHILDADGMNTHLLQLLSQLYESLIGMEWTYSIYKTALYMWLLLCLQCCINSCTQISNIVQCIKNTEYTNAMLRSLSYESTNHIIRIVVVTQQILATQQHLDRSIQMCLQGIKTLPRILIQETQASIISCTAPCLKSIVADFVQGRKHWQHLLGTHTCC